MSRSSSRARTVAGVLVAAVVVGALTLAGITVGVLRRGASARADQAEIAARLPERPADGWARRPAGGVDAARDARLEAGRRVVSRASEVLAAEWKVAGNGAPYFVTTGRLPDDAAEPWAEAIADARDERLPEPSEDVREWMELHGPALRAAAAEISAGPPPEWEQDLRWDVTREARLAGILARHFEMLAATHARRGEHGESEALLDAAWTLRAGVARLRPSELGDLVLLGALRCTRVRDADEWVRRLESVDVRAEDAGDLLFLAAQRLHRAEIHLDDAPAWLPGPVRSVLRVAPELEASMEAELATEASALLLALDPCTAPEREIPDTWERDHRVGKWQPTPARVRVAYALVRATEREIPFRLTRAVLRARAGLPPGDRCESVTSSRGPDGRVTLRWDVEPHPLAIEVGAATPREFTLEAPP